VGVRLLSSADLIERDQLHVANNSAQTRLVASLSAIDNAFKLTSFGALQSCMEETLSLFGIEYFGVDMVQAHNSMELAQPLFGNTYTSWADRYLSKRYFEYDPVLRTARAQVAPVHWQAMQAKERLQKRQIRLFDEVKDFGIYDGFCTPVWKADGTIQTVTFLSAHPLDLCVEDAATLRLLALYYVSLGERLWKPIQLTVHNDLLTPMQRECLKWVRAGKTNWETGVILGISERTVKFHIKGACARLGVHNRTQAVIEAVMQGEIDVA
jgi:LuxR family transcriptional regulator, quorum-sensing system regulator BjaR1